MKSNYKFAFYLLLIIGLADIAFGCWHLIHNESGTMLVVGLAMFAIAIAIKRKAKADE